MTAFLLLGILENRSDRLRSVDCQKAGLLGIGLKFGFLFQNFDFRNSRVSIFAIQEFRLSQSNNTDIIQTDYSHTYHINQSFPFPSFPSLVGVGGKVLDVDNVWFPHSLSYALD